MFFSTSMSSGRRIHQVFVRSGQRPFRDHQLVQQEQQDGGRAERTLRGDRSSSRERR